MAKLIQCKDVFKEYGEITLLRGINLEIEQGEKLGIVGINGAGKTTLINILMKKSEVSSGEVLWDKETFQIGYMQQAPEQTGLQEGLSGGEKTKTLLKQIFYSKCDLLVLDEPTNHLDTKGIEWLIKEIKHFKGTVILISHDRYFLDNSISKVIEIDKGELKIYKGNYSWYRDEKKKQFENQLQQFREQEKVKSKISGQIKELRNWSGKAHAQSAKKAIQEGNKMGGKEYNRVKAKKMDKQIKSRIKRLERIEVKGVQKPVEEMTVAFKLPEAQKKGSIILEARNISKCYENKVLFQEASFYIKTGEKVGLYGPNGCGKTTLIKAIMKQMSVEGEIYIHPSRRIGYISQEVSDLDEKLNILELFKVQNKKEYSDLRTELSQIGFKEDILSKKIGVLSLGERMKIKLLQLIHEAYEILILDEPTNHIDLHVREQLEKVLKAYTGTIILVTHDRYMMEKICDKVLVFEKGYLRRYEYGITEYHNRKKLLGNTFDNKKQSRLIQDKMLLENKIAYTLGHLSQLTPGTPTYEIEDERYKELMALRKKYL